jgi:hypothetical protein
MNTTNEIMLTVVGKLTEDMADSSRKLRVLDYEAGYHAGFRAGCAEGERRTQNAMKNALGFDSDREMLFAEDYMREEIER